MGIMATPRIRLKHSTVQDKAPDKTAAVLGELFVNAHENSPGIYSLTSDGEITKLTVYVADDISDVDTTTTAPASGQALVWDGSNWVPGDVGSAAGLVYKGNIDLTTDDPGTGADVGWLYSNTGAGTVKSTWNGAAGTTVAGGELCSYDGSDWNIIDTGSGGGILRIDAGDGIITTPDPLTSAGTISVDPNDSKGVEISDKKVAVKTGEGIGFDSSGGVAVETGAGLKIDGTDKVAADLGDGLEFDGDDKIAAKVGAGLEIDGSTNIAASVATTSTLGSVIVGTGLSVGTDGTLTADGGSSLQPADVKGGNGIKATTGTDDVTLAVDLAGGNDGLKIDGGKLKASVATAGAIGSVKIGSGIQVTTAGEISVSIPPSETYIGETPPGSPVEGDLWWNSSEGSGRLYVYYDDGATKQWVEAAPQGDTLTESDADTKYLSKVKADTAKGLITFEDVSTHEQGLIADEVSEFKGGVKVTGGEDTDVATGIGYDGGFLNLYHNSVAKIQTGEGQTNVKTEGTNTGLYLLARNGAIDTTGNSTYGFRNIPRLDGQPNTNVYYHYTADGASRSGGFNEGFVGDGDQVGFDVPSRVVHNVTGQTIAFKSNIGGSDNYNFYSGGNAPNYIAGSTYIGGTTSRNTFELWKSTLTEEQLEQLEAGTLVAPANVSLPGDGEFARQWYYDQQDTETQAELTAGTQEYPEHLLAANFTDTFALGDKTAINLLSSGSAEFTKNITTNGSQYNYFNNNIGTAALTLDQGALALGWNHGGGDRSSAFITATGANGTTASGGFRFYTKSKDDIQSEWVTINGYGQLTVGGATFTDDAKLTVKTISTSPVSEYNTGIKANAVFDGVASSRGLYVGFNSFAGLSNSNGVYPVIDNVNHYSCSNNNFSQGVRNATCYNSGIVVLNPDPAGLVVGEAYGFYANISSQAGDLLLDGSPATLKYNFYAAGNAPNYFAGALIARGKMFSGFNAEKTGLDEETDIQKYFDLTGKSGNLNLYCPVGGSNSAQVTNANLDFDASGAQARNAALFTQLSLDGTQTRVAGFIKIQSDGSTRINCGINGDVETTSDYRLKKNVVDMASAVEKIKQLRPVTYDFIDGPTNVDGFIAHELQAVSAKAVSGTKDETEATGTLTDYDGTVLRTAVTEPPAEELTYTENVEVDGVSTATVRTRTWSPTGIQPVYQGVDQTKLIPLLTKALQEVLAKNEELETRIAALEGA